MKRTKRKNRRRHYWPRSRIASTAACGVYAPFEVTRDTTRVTCALCLKHLARATVMARAMERVA
jgi:hypothetical protein